MGLHKGEGWHSGLLSVILGEAKLWADLSDGGSTCIQSPGDVSRRPAESVYSILDEISESLESYESILFPFLF